VRCRNGLKAQAKVVATNHDLPTVMAVVVVDTPLVAPVLASLPGMAVMPGMLVIAMAVVTASMMLPGMLAVVMAELTLMMPFMALGRVITVVVTTFVGVSLAIGHGRAGKANAKQCGEGQTHCQFTVVHHSPPVL
jgi:hypothetical protein